VVRRPSNRHCDGSSHGRLSSDQVVPRNVVLVGQSVLAGISWTEAPREPYSFIGQLKKLDKSMGFGTLSTPILIILVVAALIGLPVVVIDAYKALASGQLTFDIWLVLICLYVLIRGGTALVKRLKGP
jgi:hypothetical protein